MVNIDEYNKYLYYRRRNVFNLVIMLIIFTIIGILFIYYFKDWVSFIFGAGLIISVVMMGMYAFYVYHSGLYTMGELKHLMLSAENAEEMNNIDCQCRDFVGSCVLQFKKRKEFYDSIRKKYQ